MRDFKFLLNTPEGLMPCLAELKMIGAGKTLLPRGDKGLRAERRAGKLTKEYKSILRGYNIHFHRAALMVRRQPEPVAGPLVARFWSFGGLCEWQLVAVPWGDLSTSCSGCLPSHWWQTWAGPRGGRLGPTCWAR